VQGLVSLHHTSDSPAPCPAPAGPRGAPAYGGAVPRPDAPGLLSCCALAAVAALHALWGTGSAWPAADRDRLAEAVAGTRDMPPPAACFVVAAALTTGAALVGGAGGDGRLARLARAGVAGGLLARGVAGVTGRTALLVPWTPSAGFQALDRRRYGPFCLAVGAAAATSLARSSRTRGAA